MADQARPGSEFYVPPRRFKDNGDGTWSEVVALESGSIGGGGADPTYQEDTPSVAAEKVIMAGAVRKDTAASLVDTDGDRTELQVDSSGQLRVVTPPGGAGLTNTELRATPVPVSGTVAISNPTTNPETGLAKDATLTARLPAALDADGGLKAHIQNFPGSQAVTGPLTDTQLRASAVPVSGPLTDTQLRATPVPVSGTVTASGPLTDTQLRASAVPVDVSDRAARLLGVVDKGKIWDGTNIATVKAGVVAVAGDNPLVVTLHPSSAPTAAQPVTGTFFQGTQPVSIAAALDVSDRAARLLGVVTASGTQARAAAITANPLLMGGRAAAYPTKPTAVAAGQLVEPVTDLEGVLYIRPRIVNTYVAVYRLALAAASSALAFTYVANTDKQLATIHHAVGATKTVRIRRVWVELITIGAVAGQLQFELRRLTVAPATGNPAITPLNRNSGGAAVEATCLALPTTGGTDVSANSPLASKVFAVIASEAATVSTWPAGPSTIILFDEASADDEEEPPVIRAATAEGYAVIGRSTAAVPTTFMVRMVFTEE